jgi:hypothetical protein
MLAGLVPHDDRNTRRSCAAFEPTRSQNIHRQLAAFGVDGGMGGFVS